MTQRDAKGAEAITQSSKTGADGRKGDRGQWAQERGKRVRRETRTLLPQRPVDKGPDDAVTALLLLFRLIKCLSCRRLLLVSTVRSLVWEQ